MLILRQKYTIAAAMVMTWLACGTSALAVPIQVGVVWDHGGWASGAELVAQLNDDTFFDFNATGLPVDGADSLAELSAYDAIVIGGSGHRDNDYTAAMFAALRTYMDAGGGIVSTGWYKHETDSYGGQQEIDADYVTPIADSSYEFKHRPGTIEIVSSAHPITSGIVDFSFSGNHVEYETALDPGAVKLGGLLANSGSENTIAYQDLVGRSVYLGGLYMARTTYDNGGLRSGIEDQLLEQAVAWAGGANAAPAVPEPSTYAMAAVGLLGMIAFGWRKRRKI